MVPCALSKTQGTCADAPRWRPCADILVADKRLAAEIEYDLRQLDEEAAPNTPAAALSTATALQSPQELLFSPVRQTAASAAGTPVRPFSVPALKRERPRIVSGRVTVAPLVG